MSDTEPREISKDGTSGAGRWGLIGVIVVVVVVVIAVGLFGLASTSEVAESGSRTLHISFDGDRCSVAGPLVLSEGELEVAYENLSEERVWAQLAVLDEGFDGRDLIATLDGSGDVGPPTWARGVWSLSSLDGGQTSSSVVEVQEGFHVVVCGTWTPEYLGYFGSELRVNG